MSHRYVGSHIVGQGVLELIDYRQPYSCTGCHRAVHAFTSQHREFPSCAGSHLVAKSVSELCRQSYSSTRCLRDVKAIP